MERLRKNISPDYAEMDEGSPCFRRVNRVVSLRNRPINSKWTPIKRDDQKFNGIEIFPRVTFYYSEKNSNGWIFFIDQILYLIYIFIRSIAAPYYR